jgi:hypothetical protein
MVLGLLIAGLAIFTLGLNLTMIYNSLKLTTENPRLSLNNPAIITGSIILVVGLIVMNLGILSHVWKTNEQATIITTGSSIALMGGLGIVRVGGKLILKDILRLSWGLFILGLIFILIAWKLAA